MFPLFFKYNKSIAFSIVELLIVLVIISILLSFSIVYYTHYKEKAYLVQDGILLAEHCMDDLVAYCISNPGKEVNQLNISSCQSTTSVFGVIYSTVDAPIATCSAKGELPDNYTIVIRSSATNRYYIKCTYYQLKHMYRCMIEETP
jgi:type II secretory pathway pseudopilin PulG